MKEEAIREREAQLLVFIGEKIGASSQRFSDPNYSLASHTSVLREADELLKVWEKVKASLKGDK